MMMSRALSLAAVAALAAMSGLPLENGGEVVVFAGETAVIAVETADPDGDLVTLSVEGLPSWGSFDGSSITLSPGYSDREPVEIVIRAVDDGESWDLEAGEYRPDPKTAEQRFLARPVRKNRKPGISCWLAR